VSLLLDGDAESEWPVGGSFEAVAPRGCILVALLLLELAAGTVMGEPDGMVAVGVTLSTLHT
jgi:hypothetical protein